jgi:hypothetical protein|eukprot:COSAG02_NODE_441_length_22281_cov_6.119556_21_plen_335_part_00
MATDADAEAMAGSGDMLNSGDDNNETDPVEPGEGEGDKPKRLKLDGRGNPFAKHPESWSLFTSITESRYRDNIMVMEQELLDYAEGHQMMLRDRLTYEELLDGMLYPGEMRIPIKPMLIGDMMNCDHDGNVLNERIGVRMFLTNRRIFFLDADLERIPMLEESNADLGKMTLSKMKVSYEVTDDIWYYPVPLSNLKGVSLDIHFATSAHGWITQKRPWWAILVWLFGMGMLAHAVVQREKLGDWEDMNFLYAASTLAGLGPIIFLFLKVYGRSDFSPRMEQEREITLGCKDPITQQHRIYRLLLEEGYPMIEAKNYLSIMQEYAPHLSGVVLAD